MSHSTDRLTYHLYQQVEDTYIIRLLFVTHYFVANKVVITYSAFTYIIVLSKVHELLLDAMIWAACCFTNFTLLRVHKSPLHLQATLTLLLTYCDHM